MTERTLTDRMKGVGRQIRALNRDPAEWEPEDLDQLQRLITQANAQFCEAVTSCRDNGATDAEIAEALGVTRQAVSKRWPGGGRYVGAAGQYRGTRVDYV